MLRQVTYLRRADTRVEFAIANDHRLFFSTFAIAYVDPPLGMH